MITIAPTAEQDRDLPTTSPASEPRPLTPKEINFYWANVIRGASPDDCWDWKGRKQRGTHPYGRMKVSGRDTTAQRVSYEIHSGPIPRGLHILHRCDNPPCTNPAHLMAGTPKENMHDMIRKGRARHESMHGRSSFPSKLTSEKVWEILEKLDNGMARNSVAAEYGVDVSAIGHIVRGKNWREVVNKYREAHGNA